MFSENTALHGFKYVVSKKMTAQQRMLWGTAMAFAAGVTAWYLLGVWEFAQSNLTITNIDTMQYPIGQVVFPAVILCSFNLIRKSEAQKLIDSWHLLPGDNKTKLLQEMRALPITMFKGRTSYLTPKLLKSALVLNRVSIESLMKQLAVPCEDLILRCKWNDNYEDCSTMFRMTKTSEGYGCAFNYIGDYNSSQIHGMSGENKERMLPTSGYENGLIALVKTDREDYHSTLYASFGTMVLINRPRNYPDTTSRMIAVPPNNLMMISYTPRTTGTSEEVLKMSPEKRNCIWQQESKLAFFYAYTYHNCIIECRMNFTAKVCGCVLTSFPNNGMYRVCDLNDLPCLASHQVMIDSYSLGLDAEDDDDEQTPINKLQDWATPCNCKPKCFYTRYVTGTSISPLNFTHYNTDSKFFQGLNLSSGKYSLIHVFPQDLIAIRHRRDVYSSMSSLFGSFGALLSFFLGFNMVCVAELIFFLVLKPLANITEKKIFMK